jgi:hypothetical protein
MSRREALALGGTVVVGGSVALGLRQWTRHERGLRAEVHIGGCASYAEDVAAVVLEGLRSVGIVSREVRHKRILLKPNLVETAEGHAHINTHPAVVVGAAEAFRQPRVTAATAGWSSMNPGWARRCRAPGSTSST